MINECFPIPGISDHEALYIQSYISIPSPSKIKKKIYLWSKANLSDIQQVASDMCLDFLQKRDVTAPVETLWQDFKNICNTCLNKVPSKNCPSTTSQPWITNRVRCLCRKKKHYFRYARQSSLPEHWERYQLCKTECRRECRRECRNAHNKYVANLIKGNSICKKFWSFIKSKKKDYCGIAPLKVNETIVNDPQQKAETLNYFSSVYTQDDSPSISCPNVCDIVEMPPINVDNDGVLKLLLDLQPHKATGPDKIPTCLLKEVAYIIVPVLILLFQASLDQACLPDEWKTANVCPIFKKNNRSNPSNYHSLTCVYCKLLEHIMHHLDDNSILIDEQHGFRGN